MNRSVNLSLPSSRYVKVRLFFRPIRLFLFLFFITFFAQKAFAQLTGTKTVPGDFPSLASAISALNVQGVGTGGVTINLLAGNPETSPNGGYIIGGNGSLLLTTTSTTNQVLLQGNGNTITAPTTLISGSLNDAIFKIIGADWITLDGFVMIENPANLTTNPNSNNMIEWGVALLYATTTNGAQNITIKNNSIDLNRTYPNTFGIYSNSTHGPATPTISATATTSDGGNHGLKIYSNTITDVNNGILVVGPIAAEDYNMAIDIGGVSSSTANTLTNYGTTGTFSAFANVSLTVYGILVRNSIGYNVSWNSISSSNGGTTSDTLRGIFIPDFSFIPVGTFTNTINHNTISVVTGVAAAPLMGIAVEDSTSTQTSTLHIDYNNFTNCGFTAGAPTGKTTFIRDAVNNLVTTVSHNTFTNLTISSSGLVRLIQMISSAPEEGSQTIHNNSIVTAFTKTAGAAADSVICLANSGATIAESTVFQHTNNNFSNITVTGGTILMGMENLDGLSTTQTTKTITGNTFSNWTAGTGKITVMHISYVGGETTISKNTISNITTQDSVRGISLLIGANNANPLTIDSNNISNITTTNGNIIAIRCTNLSPVINVSNNTIHSLSSSLAGAKLFGISAGGLANASANIFQNVIHTFIASGTGSPVVNGIYISGGSTYSIYKNKVYNLQRTGTGGTIPVNGISITAGTTINIHNNLIGHLNCPAVSLPDAVRGISINSTTANSVRNVYYNTVYLNASSTGSNFGSTGIYHTTTSTATNSTLDLKNNIIVNGSTPNGTGKTVAYRRSSTTLTNYTSTSNNNLFYAGTPGASNLIFFDGTNSDQTLSTFKARVTPRETFSVSENVPFMNTSGSDPNYLHISPTIGTQVESAGTPIGGYTIDFDGHTRNGITPDIGADEGTFMVADFLGPQISYALFLNTGCTMDRVLTATITDASGVNSSGGTKPRLYFRKSTNTNAFTGNTSATNGWKYVEASNTESPFSFTTNFGLLFGGTGVSQGDSVYYFIVAQDLVPTTNVGMNSGTFHTVPTSVALTGNNFPVTGAVNGFEILPAGLAGTVTIGASGTYTSLTGTSGLFNELNTKGISGELLAQIIDTALTENGTVVLEPITYTTCSGGPYTFTIKPMVNTILSGSNSDAIIRIDGADYVTIDGSTGTIENTVCPTLAASRDMTIANTHSSNSSAVIWIQSTGSNGATNNTIRNCIISGNSNTTTLFGIGSGGATISISSLGNGNHNNAFINNTIQKTQYGIYTQGASASNKNLGTIINQNLINFGNPGNVSVCGIRVGFESGMIISGNEIAHLAGSSTVAGISLGLMPSNTYSAFAGNEVTDALVSKNKLDDIVSTGDGTSLGIVISEVTTAGSPPNVIANNMISNVRTEGANANNFPAGILIGGGIHSATQVYYNSISLAGIGSSSGPGFGIAIGGSNPVIDLQNNILVNRMTSTSGTMYAIGLGYSTYSNLTSDHNNFFTPQEPIAVIGGLGNSPAGNQGSLSAWQLATGNDGESLNIDPVFISPSDLHIDGENPANQPLDDGAVSISITDDFDCESRETDIGADEFVLVFCTMSSGGIASINGPTSFCGSGIPIITATDYSTGVGTFYQWMAYPSINTPPAGGTIVEGQVIPSSLGTGLLSSTSHYRLRVICNTSQDTMYSNLVTITIYPHAVAAITGPSTMCQDDPAITLSESGGSGVSWIWSNSESNASIQVSPLLTSNYSVTVTSSDGCTASATKRVIVHLNPSAPSVMPDIPQAFCLGNGQYVSAFSAPNVVSIIDEDFSSTTPGDSISGNLPIGWTGSSMTQGSRIWGVVSSAQGGNHLGDGNFLYCESDQYFAFQTRAQVVTPSFNASSFSSLTVRFIHYYNDIESGAGTDSARVYVSNDDGINYTLIQSWDTEQGTSLSGAGAVSAIIPAGISLTSSMRVKLVYNSDQDGNDWYWAVDNFIIEGIPISLYAWTAPTGAGIPPNAGEPLAGNSLILATPTLPGTYVYSAITTGAGCSSAPSVTAEVTAHPTIVTNLSDADVGSLRHVISCAPAGATITFHESLTDQTITLTSGEIVIDKNLTLFGLGILNLTVSGQNLSRIFHVHPMCTVALSNMALKDGNATTQGGALLLEGTLILDSVRFQNNMENGVAKAMTSVSSATIMVNGPVEVKY